MQNVCILGATGSIGQNTIDVVLRHPEQYCVYALTAHNSIEKLIEQAKLCQPTFIVLSDANCFKQAKQALVNVGLKTELLCGAQALADVASA
ncbi:MAG: 1-deoxy-D-xylulose-5-phosphate reductoisomerase, partial [Paraglaciecola polaris]